MRVDYITTNRKNKSYTYPLLRHAYRDKDGKVKHKTIANLSKLPKEQVKILELALKKADDFEIISQLITQDEVSYNTSYSIGAVYLLYQIARRIGLVESLGYSKYGKIVLWQVISRLIKPMSKVGCVRLSNQHAVLEVLNMEDFNEDDVYESLGWLDENQARIENKLFELNKLAKSNALYLYDVTSSYFEGDKNELSAYGYNRDKKLGKKQIVIGLLTDSEGYPVSVNVYRGDTSDVKTFNDQLDKIRNRFGVREVVFVGDKGMLKNEQQEAIVKDGGYYITSITKAQIRRLMEANDIDMTLFDKDIQEIVIDGVRYIFRRNEFRAMELRRNREDKLEKMKLWIEKKNMQLKERKRSRVDKAYSKGMDKLKKLKIEDWFILKQEGNLLSWEIDELKLEEKSKLDGCYVVKTNVPMELANKELIHSRYKDLCNVEKAFKDIKTELLEVRPIYVRKASHTRAHVFIVMLSYLLKKHLEKYWKDINMTISEAIHALVRINAIEIKFRTNCIHIVPEGDDIAKKLLSLADVKLPKMISIKKRNVDNTTKI